MSGSDRNPQRDNHPGLTELRPAGHALDIEEVRDMRRFEELGTAWNRLLDSTGSPTLYLTHEWLSTWWRCHRSGSKSLLILVVTDGDELKGIAPLMEVRSNVMGVRYTRIEFLSTMQFAYSPENCSGALDIIALPPVDDVVRAVLDYLLRKKDSWQLLRLHPVPRSSGTPDVLCRECQTRHLPYSRQTAFSNFIIPVDRPWEEYSAQRSHDFTKKYYSAEKKALHFGRPVLKEYSGQGDIAKGLEKVTDIERHSWKQEHGVPIDADGHHGFYIRFAEIADAKGWLKLNILEVDGCPVAYDYSVCYSNRLESLKTSYNEDYRACSPGTLLSWRVFEQAFKSGVRSINLLWGDSWSKRQWTTHTIMYDELIIFNQSPFSKLCYFIAVKLPFYRLNRSLMNRARQVLRRTGTGKGERSHDHPDH